MRCTVVILPSDRPGTEVTRELAELIGESKASEANRQYLQVREVLQRFCVESARSAIEQLIGNMEKS